MIKFDKKYFIGVNINTFNCDVEHGDGTPVDPRNFDIFLDRWNRQIL
jgi:hypothetical protein